MKRRVATTVATYGLLCAAGGVSFLLPDSLTVPASQADPPPSSYDLTGILRDFRKTHADFNASASGGPGHYAGNVNTWLPGYQRPLFVAGGYKVATEWRDSSARPIAPNLANVVGGAGQAPTLGIRVADKIDVKDESIIDSFNTNRGRYGVAGNYGSAAYVSTNSIAKDKIKVDDKCALYGDAFCGPTGAPGTVIGGKGLITGDKAALATAHTMPDIALPEDLGANLGDVTIVGPAPAAWTGDTNPDDDIDVDVMQFDDLVITDNAILNVTGDLRVMCQTLKVDKKAQIILAPSANLTFYVIKNADLKISDEALVNVGSDDVDTGIVTINYLGNKEVKVEKKAHVYATIVAPAGDLKLNEEAHVYGAFVGQKLTLDKKSWFHVDSANGDMGVYNPAILVRDKIEIDDKCVVDSFDSNVGPYDGPPPGGGTNWGSDALVQTNAVKNDMVKIKNNSKLNGDVLVGAGASPSSVIKLESGGQITGSRSTLAEPLPIPVVAPPPMGPSVGDVTYEDVTATLSTDLHCKKLKIEKAILEISGNVTIRCDDRFDMKDRAEIVLLPNSTLTLYVSKDSKIEDRCKINMNTGNPQLVSFRRISMGKRAKIEIKKDSEVCAWIQGAKTELKLEDKAAVFGNFMGEKVTMKKSSKLHVDMAYLITCIDVADAAGTAGAPSSGGITSEATFDEWFKDTVGVNQSRPHTITLTDVGSGVYVYDESAFHPIDDELIGNEGELHNHHLTYAIKAMFTYDECAGQFIEFTGGDGAWLYINRHLVIDLGGVQSGTSQIIELDRLGLADGADLEMHLFYAQRRSVAASTGFKLRTNLHLSTESVLPTSLASFD
jgi:fibro-slime domain-containing protein